MGKSKPKEPSSSKAQAEISKALFQQSDPIRRAMIGMNMGFLGIPGQEPQAQQPQMTPQLAAKFPEGFVSQDPIQTTSFSQIDPSVLPQFGAAKMIAEGQYKRARDNAISNIPRGGPMAEALTNLDIGKAQQMTGLSADLVDRQLQQAFSLATGMPAQAMSGLGSSAAAQAQAQQAAASQNAAKGQALGTLGAATIMKNPGAAVVA